MININMENTLSFSISKIDKEVLKYIKKKFRMVNPKYNENDEESEKNINIYTIDNDKNIHFPRGSSRLLSNILKDNDIDFKIKDNRLLLEQIKFPTLKFTPFNHQAKAIKKGYLLTQGTIESPCGSGKTIIGVGLISVCCQPSLVIVPDNEILKQWIERLDQALGIDLDRIGVLTSEKIFYNDVRIDNGIKDITIATNASLYRKIEDEDFCNKFGFVILDECHIVGARTFREVMNSFPARYRYGLTATPFRTDNLSELIECYCGTQFITISDDDLLEAGLLVRPQLYRVDTKFKYKYNFKYATAYNYMLKALQTDKKRNELILKHILEEYNEGRMVLVVAKQVSHCETLKKLIKKKDKKIRIGFMAGEDYNDETAELARQGKIDVILSVDRAKQGLDIKPLETVMIVAPRKAKGEIQQIVGRVARPDTCFGKYKNPNDKIAKVIDFVDPGVVTISGGEMLINAYEERYEVYEEKCDIIRG